MIIRKRIFAFIILIFIMTFFVIYNIYHFDGHIWFTISGKISNNNQGISGINIYFTDKYIMPNEIEIEKKLIGKTNKDGKIFIKYGYPFSYTDYIFVKTIYRRIPLLTGDFIITLEKNNYEIKELKFNIHQLKKNRIRVFLEINEEMKKCNQN